ncbi:MAG: MotA/TolQ/ExbB proton channel family protein [Planctomycetes bacterium]|nr:MotA/TolQ/ExbB proton channel family protein [Planctomycetota bacterium]
MGSNDKERFEGYLLISFFGNAVFLFGQVPATADPGASWLEIFFSGGPIGVTIMVVLILLSITAVALCAENVLSIRSGVLMPPGLAECVQQRLSQGDLAAARQLCDAQPSFLGFVVRNALAEAEGGWPAVEKALEDTSAEQAARLYRKVEYLSVIANLATMLGLLGTVVGLIMAFREVAASQGAARPADLASGIYHALVSTVAGLVIAIPSLGAFAVFRNRVDEWSAETAYAAQHAILPMKRALAARRAANAPPPPAPPSGTGVR